jgi:hypothetical protein
VLESATSETFAPHVGSEFEATSQADEVLHLVLTSCEEDAASGPPDAERIPFSLIFRDAGATRYAPQQTFTIRHPELGEFPLFLVPLGPGERGVRYQAVIG